ncbi:MAG: alanine--tRNA ligase [Candidatus Harrisonbacteria bacterium CG10_big_fil_rev_8_21_14_0_10_45_28]|uniref:alanine--tRNA ligase n=1 Tax=Candidatus Harrisonbacteria bacterium CG10_big_fil_rev_8_21_14_0_10_45_28 TaxID=1974586 RepID=A0A2H0UP30_9BACT|nr:MAG: alanine--tRNA ligase [Candidatus Harrisonbacteria bacterium CG10_big_fil_rev_8_21_14_0_10_45_28]
MKSEEIRDKFLKFFEKRGHAVVPSSSLVPTDPSVLLTSAGMQQFKPYFTGEMDSQKDFGSMNTASSQKCFRTVDIDEVGDNTHQTFFEMLGNFSFGGYFKREAIQYAYDFIVNEMGLKISYVTVFEGSHGVSKDEESKAIWKSLGIEDVREESINDVFWGPTGTSGPCGPTTEIYVRTSAGEDVEVWNIVFNQFFYNGSREDLLANASDKQLTPLKTPGIDTGMGFERLVIASQGVASSYDTDIFQGILAKVQEFTGGVPVNVARVFADHMRASVFLISDGVRPSNKEAGYVLRRLLRRMMGYKVAYDIHGDIFGALYPVIKEKFSRVYPEIDNKDVLAVISEEEERFIKALTLGLGELKKHKDLTAKEAFMISSTFGINFELMVELAPEATEHINREDFDKEFEGHQEISRAGLEKKFGGHGLILDTGELKASNEEELKSATRLHTATHLTQEALRRVLGKSVAQAGSDITPERFRFDFTFDRKLTDEEIGKVEEIVNDVVAKDLPVGFKEMGKEEAEKTGALYFFKEKYPERVKVYYVGHDLDSAFSKEFCGGPHVSHTGEIGKFKIQKEKSVGSGIRRIKAIVE